MLRGVEATVTLKMTELFDYDLPEVREHAAVGCCPKRSQSAVQVAELVSFGLQEMRVSMMPAHPRRHLPFSLPPLREPPFPALLPCLAGHLCDE